MARSVLLQLARDSIEEVFQAKRKIDKKLLVKEHPLLKQNIDASVTIYLKDKTRGFCSSENSSSSLI